MPANKQIPGTAVARAWVAQWRDGRLGWAMPMFLWGKRPAAFTDHQMLRGAKELYLCEVTIVPVLDKLGRPVKRTARGLRSLTKD